MTGIGNCVGYITLNSRVTYGTRTLSRKYQAVEIRINMNVENFVAELIKQTPSEDMLRNISHDDDFVRKHRSNVQLYKQNEQSFSDELLNLVANYNADVVEIGMITLASLIKESEDYYHVGSMELEYLVISKVTNEVVVLEHATKGHILYKCARNGALFLEAMLIANTFLNRCLFEDDLWEDKDVLREVTFTCAETAGGQYYKSFYDELLGYFDC